MSDLEVGVANLCVDALDLIALAPCGLRNVETTEKCMQRRMMKFLGKAEKA